MSNESGYSGGTKNANKRPNRDLRLAKRFNRMLKNDKQLSSAQLRKLAHVVSRSEAHDNLSTKDRKAIRGFLGNVDKYSKESFIDSPWRDDDTPMNKTNAYDMLKRLSYDPLTSLSPNKPRSSGVQGGRAGFLQQHNKTGGKGRPKPGGDSEGGSKGRPGGRRGKSGGQGRGNFTQGGMSYYGLGEFPGVSRRAAKVEVGRENNRLIQALLDEAKDRGQDLKYDVNQINSLFNRSKGDLNYVFNEAGDYIGNRNQAINAGYEGTGNKLSGIYAALQGKLGQTSGENRDAALAEQARLGIQQSGLGRFDADANNMQMLAQASGANAQANNSSAQSMAAEIGNLLGSMSKASLASAVGRATNTRNDAISDSRQDYRQGVNDIRGDIREVNKNRPAAINELHRAMEDAAYQRWAEGQQMDFQNQLAANNFNLDVSRLNSDNLWKRAAQRAEARRARDARRLAQQEAAVNRTSNDLSRQSESLGFWDILNKYT